jgi:ribose transport system permease protein
MSGSATPTTLDPALATARPRTTGRRGVPELAGLGAVLVGLIVFFSLASEYFLNTDNLVNVLAAVAVTGIIAAPATLLLVAGHLDLSVGSAAAFCGALLAVQARDGGLAEAIALAVAAGIGIGMLNGFVTTVVGVSSLVTTIGTLAIFRGLTQVVTDGQTVNVDGFAGLGTSRPVLDLPLPVILLVVVAIAVALLMRFTVYGRSMYAIGANPVAARLCGIRIRWSVFAGFVLTGACVALGGLIIASQVGSATPTAASGLELSVITAVVLGGASLTGGRGTVAGTMLGLLIIGVLNNGLVLLDVGSFWQDVARGTLLVLAVSFDQLRARISPVA